MAFCSNCGSKVIEGAKFCQKCGCPLTSQNTRSSSRRQEYAGKIYKCPNCGETVDAFMSKCPLCGYEIRGQRATDSISELYRNIQIAKSEEAAIRLIQLFPVPNNKEDIIEFMVLASSNFNEANYLLNASIGAESISGAWLSKIEQCYKKATLTLSDADMLKIDNIYTEIQHRISAEQHRANEKKKSWETASNVREFKRSKFRVVLIVFTIISAIACSTSLTDGNTFSGVIYGIICLLFLISIFMGYGIIKEKVQNFRLVPAIIAFALFILPLYSLGSSTSAANDDIAIVSWEELLLGENIPDLGYSEAEILYNNADNLLMYFYDVDSSKYDSYVNECKTFGYTVDAEEDENSYTAYNQDGYFLSLQYSSYSSNRLSLKLKKPIETNQIIWPNSDLVKTIPKPKSLVGEVTEENSSSYSVYLTGLDRDCFTEYVSQCMNLGFNVDYSKSDTNFSAENTDGISLTVQYKGFNTLYISISGED